MIKNDSGEVTQPWLGRLIGWFVAVLLCLLLAMIVWNVYLQFALSQAKGRVFILEMQCDRLLSMVRLSYEVNAFYSQVFQDEVLGKPFENWEENEANIRFNYNIPKYSEYPQEKYDKMLDKEAEMVACGKYR